MKLKKQICVLILFTLSVLFLYQPLLFATDDSTIAVSKKRPMPEFDHTLHEDALEEPGCGACHHILDETSNKLIYSQGDESNCSECHAQTAVDDIPGLREANHASCTACHRDLKKVKEPAGPTTCGECHKK
ncbi:MAG: cytochrome c family protein [Desulfobacula sp.]|nr:cytochrome c family protein [Desulfobacula sp.]